ncbi:CTNS [Bugula neritina]|uniref:CTNS n=1 Tax=Bugula neritina TaxID=10212 RepID=A0A7J7KP17_BUGNE|nr:CTNS [Bugula neritina]
MGFGVDIEISFHFRLIHEYHQAHPHDVIPVEVNDVVFALHAFFITCVTIGQTAIYERGTQKVSKICIGIASLAVLAIFIFIILAAVPSVATFNWLSMVYGFSYVKLGITIIKYMPQAWMNYRRKSTVGWSIGNILLDFTGGTGSILQMLLLAYNFNDWASIFTNPAKFWLGALSILFDILFMVQHYILYRNRLEDYERI